MYSAYIAAVTTRNVVPIATTRRRFAVRTTIVSSTEITQSEHGLMPSTKPMMIVEARRLWSSSEIVPMSGTSISAPVWSGAQTSSSDEHVPVRADEVVGGARARAGRAEDPRRDPLAAGGEVDGGGDVVADRVGPADPHALPDDRHRHARRLEAQLPPRGGDQLAVVGVVEDLVRGDDDVVALAHLVEPRALGLALRARAPVPEGDLDGLALRRRRGGRGEPGRGRAGAGGGGRVGQGGRRREDDGERGEREGREGTGERRDGAEAGAHARAGGGVGHG